MLIETSRSKLDFTHFISIPVNVEEVQKNFEKFKEDILNAHSSGVRGIKEEIFQLPQKLHLTVCILILLDEEDRKKAVSILEGCKRDIVL